MDGNKKSSVTVTTAKEEKFSESNLLKEKAHYLPKYRDSEFF